MGTIFSRKKQQYNYGNLMDVIVITEDQENVSQNVEVPLVVGRVVQGRRHLSGQHIVLTQIPSNIYGIY